MTTGTASCTTAGAEVAAGGVEAERPALLRARGRRTRCSPSSEAKLPPPTPASAATASRTPERRAPGSARTSASADRRDEQQQRRDDGPVAAAEDRHRERVGDPQRRADEARQRDEPELLVDGQDEPGRRQQRDDDAPQRPDGEAEELGEDRQAEVAAGDPAAAAPPERRVLGVPAVDPAAGAVDRCGGGDRGRDQGGTHLERRHRVTCGGRHEGSFSGSRELWDDPGSVTTRCFPALRMP